jgi:hypothetical protein
MGILLHLKYPELSATWILSPIDDFIRISAYGMGSFVDFSTTLPKIFVV